MTRWLERWKELFGDILVIIYGVWMVYVFSHILLYGSFVGVEPHPWLIKAELLLSVLIMILGIERLIKDLS
jgi:putative Mn2+ efflux pump MntP